MTYFFFRMDETKYKNAEEEQEKNHLKIGWNTPLYRESRMKMWSDYNWWEQKQYTMETMKCYH